MFLSTIRQRVTNHSYKSVDEFTSDVSTLLNSVPKASSSLKDKVCCRILLCMHFWFYCSFLDELERRSALKSSPLLPLNDICWCWQCPSGLQ